MMRPTWSYAHRTPAYSKLPQTDDDTTDDHRFIETTPHSPYAHRPNPRVHMAEYPERLSVLDTTARERYGKGVRVEKGFKYPTF